MPQESKKYYDKVLEEMAIEDQKPIAERNYTAAMDAAAKAITTDNTTDLQGLENP
jgi:hypothetical protein